MNSNHSNTNSDSPRPISNGVNLVQKVCVACEGGIPPLAREQMAEYLPEVPEWNVSDDAKSLWREFKFKNYVEAMEFANKITPLAEREGHHPDLFVSWGHVRVSITTHAIKGLSENDFILAAKIDQL